MMKDIHLPGYTRVSRTVAGRLYVDQQRQIFVTPVNVIPDGETTFLHPLPSCLDTDKTFDELVDEYTFDYCVNNVTGRYAAFFIREVV